MYCKLEHLLLKEGQSEEEVDDHEVLKFYGGDFGKDTLLTQLLLIPYKLPYSLHL